MGTTKRTRFRQVTATTEREKRSEEFFGALVKLLKKQEQQLETLLKERKSLEERINAQHQRWVSDVRLFQDQIAMMKQELSEKELTILLKASQCDLLTGLKHREASLQKLNLELTENELADFEALFDCLSSNPIRNSEEPSSGNKVGKPNTIKTAGSKELEVEVKRLKREIKEVVSKKDSEISALLKEKGFVWKQYNELEANLTGKLNHREAEVAEANKRIADLQSRMELLQACNDEKDESIDRLETKVIEMETDSTQLKLEVSKLSQELELLKKLKTAQATPTLNQCDKKTKSSTNGIKSNSGRNRRSSSCNVTVQKEPPRNQTVVPLKVSEKGSRSLRRKRDDEVIVVSETPKLFSSKFKAPRVKITSTPVR